MAIMIPNKPHEYEDVSMEGEMYAALSGLPNDYYIIHSFKIADINDGVFRENEGDFVIFHPRKGLICIEAKAGRVRYSYGTWYYGNGKEMPHGGPFRQAENIKWRIRNRLTDLNRSNILGKCKLLHAVWFPSISEEAISKAVLPSECCFQQILPKEALFDPQHYVDAIFDIDILSGGKKVETKLSDVESEILFRDILCPQFDIVPTASATIDLNKLAFHHLLKEQCNVLDFLEGQKTAIINGIAGTGKTLIGVEKARRNAEKGDRVLFLCYNKGLQEYLYNRYKEIGVSFFTIDGFACKICKTGTPNYELLAEKVIEMIDTNSFEYKHIIIDEGQDFGFPELEQSGVMEYLKEAVCSQNGGSFFVFYDFQQLVQTRSYIPEFIRDADCKLTLYRNCRNTSNIAKTSVRALNNGTETNIEMRPGCLTGSIAEFHYCSNTAKEEKVVNESIRRLHEKGITDIVILTMKTEAKSFLSSKIENGLYDHRVRFSTCRKFKGLEADAIILVDVDKDSFEEKEKLLFYVGASRARLKLIIISSLNDDECVYLLREHFQTTRRIRQPKRELANALNSNGYNK